MKYSFPEDSRTLIIAAVILSCTLTKDRSADDIARMAAFFTLVGDTLALMALHPGLLSASADTPSCPESPDAFPCGLSPSENHPSRLSQCSSTPKLSSADMGYQKPFAKRNSHTSIDFSSPCATMIT